MSTLDHVLPDSHRHALGTRLLHGTLALAVATQLLTSLVMTGPDAASAGDDLFAIHRWGGMVGLAAAVLLWVAILSRREGTSPGALFPWASRERLGDLWADLRLHAQALRHGRLPDPSGATPLASAVHGLGLGLVSVMALTGAAYLAEVTWLGASTEPDGMWVMAIHTTLANLVWAYLIGHAALAVLHDRLHHLPLSAMWSLRR